MPRGRRNPPYHGSLPKPPASKCRNTYLSRSANLRKIGENPPIWLILAWLKKGSENKYFINDLLQEIDKKK